MIQTRSQTKDSGLKIAEVYGAKKGVDLNLRPEWLVKKSQKLAERFRIEEKKTESPKQRNQVIDQVHSGQRKETRKTQIEQGRDNIPEQGYDPQKPIISLHPNPITKPTPKIIEKVTQDDRQIDLELDLEINKDFEENSPYQGGIISEIYHRPHKSQTVDPPEFIDLVNIERIVQKSLPKQVVYRKNSKSPSKKGIERNTPSLNHKRDPSRIFEQSLFQRSIFVSQ